MLVYMNIICECEVRTNAVSDLFYLEVRRQKEKQVRLFAECRTFPITVGSHRTLLQTPVLLKY